MKKILLISLFSGLFIVQTYHAQAPEAFNYQCVLRDNVGTPVSNSQVGIRFSILQGSAMGTSVYSEEHTTTSNGYGLITLAIGTGNSTEDLSLVNWGNGPYYIYVEADPSGGTGYVDVTTTQMLSVPYALYAKYGEDDDTDPGNELNTGFSLNATSDSLVISDAGGNYLVALTDLQDGVDDADSDPANELISSVVLAGNDLVITDAGGIYSIDLSSLTNSGTDDQNIQGSGLAGTDLTISIEGGTSETIDLSSLQDGIGTDDQNLTLTIDSLLIEDGAGVALSSLGTDDQNIQGSGLAGTDLTISIEGGTSETIDLSSLQDGIGTDDQNLTLTIDSLLIEDGAGVALSSLGTDDQGLTGATLTGTTLQIDIEDGVSTTVDLVGLQDGVVDADADPTNELNTGVALNGTSLEVTDAGGILSTDLSSLQDGTGSDDQNLTLTNDSLLIEDGAGVSLRPFRDHDWYKSPNTGVGELSDNINNDIYTMGKVAIGNSFSSPAAYLDVIGGGGNIGTSGSLTPGLRVYQEWWGPSQAISATTRLLKLDHVVMPSQHSGAQVTGYGIDYQLFSQGPIPPSAYLGSAEYIGISSKGNARDSENFTAGYFNATHTGSGTSTALHTDGSVKLENLAEDIADTDKMLVIGSNNEVYWKNLSALVGCNVNYIEDFSTWSTTTGTIPTGWEFNVGCYSSNPCGLAEVSAACLSSDNSIKISETSNVVTPEVNINGCSELILSFDYYSESGNTIGPCWDGTYGSNLDVEYSVDAGLNWNTVTQFSNWTNGTILSSTNSLVLAGNYSSIKIRFKSNTTTHWEAWHIDNIRLASSGTNQDLSLNGNTLSLSQDPTSVNLTAYLDNTDEQDLSLSGNTLSLTNDLSSVDLSLYLDNTDNQDLNLSGNTLSLTNDNTTVDLTNYLDSKWTRSNNYLYPTNLSENVGIGTPVPSTLLDVNNGTLKVTNQSDGAVLLDLNTEHNWQFRQLGTGLASALELASVGGGGNKNFLINTLGYVGITNNLSIGSTYSSSNTAPANGLIVEGKVGIGTSEPEHDLDVSQTGGLMVGYKKFYANDANISDGYEFISNDGNGTNAYIEFVAPSHGRMLITLNGSYGSGQRTTLVGEEISFKLTNWAETVQYGSSTGAFIAYDNDASYGFHVEFIMVGLTPGTTYTMYPQIEGQETIGAHDNVIGAVYLKAITLPSNFNY